MSKETDAAQCSTVVTLAAQVLARLVGEPEVPLLDVARHDGQAIVRR